MRDVDRRVRNFDWRARDFDWRARDFDWCARDFDWRVRDLDWRACNLDRPTPTGILVKYLLCRLGFTVCVMFKVLAIVYMYTFSSSQRAKQRERSSVTKKKSKCNVAGMMYECYMFSWDCCHTTQVTQSDFPLITYLVLSIHAQFS